jgi:hypothetical protein
MAGGREVWQEVSLEEDRSGGREVCRNGGLEGIRMDGGWRCLGEGGLEGKDRIGIDHGTDSLVNPEQPYS